MRWSRSPISAGRRRRAGGFIPAPAVDCLERRELLATAELAPAAGGADLPPGVHAFDPANTSDPTATPPPGQLLTTQDVQALLQRAAAASNLDGAIIAVVDRNGAILGVRVENGVAPQITSDTINRVFAIDGAVSLARTAALFANDTAPITSRTVQDISQTTITQREVQSNPDVPDQGGASTIYGPGYVAPVGLNGHFPPGYHFQPQADFFDVEGTNRDTISNATGTRFNVPAQDISAGADLVAPESYGQVTGLLPSAQSRGIATLPGGIPLYKRQPDGTLALVGGIGVYFPGTTGYATEENSGLNEPTLNDPRKPDFSALAEYIAFVAAGGSAAAGVPFNGPVNGAPALRDFSLPFGRIDENGITLDFFGGGGLQGIKRMLGVGRAYPPGSPGDGVDEPVDAAGDTYLAGRPVPVGWLVTPHDGGGLTAAEVQSIISRGVAEATQVRAQFRLPLNNATRMVFAVSDASGDILGLYRMPDATTGSLQVAVTEARNLAYFDNPTLLQPADRIKGVPTATAMTSRTLRYVSLPHFPEGIDIYPPGPGSILTDGGTTHVGTIKGARTPASAFRSLQGYADFHPNANFHDPYQPDNQSGVVLFPGGAPLYREVATGGTATRALVGGLGVSGDGAFQDDDVAAVAALAYAPPSRQRADFVKLRGVRLPFFKFNRNPHLPIGGSTYAEQPIRPLPLPRPSAKKTRA